jgi:integrase
MNEKQVRNRLDLPKYEPQGHNGSYQWAKKDQEKREKELRTKFEQKLKTAKETLKSRPVSITEAKGNLYLQFTTYIQYDGTKDTSSPIRSKYSVAQYLGMSKCADSPEAINSALEVALKVAKELETGTFTWDNYVCWIKGELPKHIKQQVAKQKTCKELTEEFKAHFWATHDFSTEEAAHKSERGWKSRFQPIFNQMPLDKPLTEEVVKNVLGRYKPGSGSYRIRLLDIKTFIVYHSLNIDVDKFKSKAKVESQIGRELSNDEIIQGWKNIKYFQPAKGKKSKHQDLFAWMYGMMAVYGLRNHEVLNIQNLTQPFKIPNKNIVLPAFNDPNNEIKSIYTYGKTGKRTQPMPLPREWIKLFQLENVPNFPVFENLRQKDSFLAYFTGYCTGHTNSRTPKKIDFIPYDLRHTYAIRGRKLGINPLDMKDYCGHSLTMHEKVYNKGIKTESLIEGAKRYQQQIQENSKLSEVEKLRIENQELKEQIKELNSKIELLLEKLSEKH